MLSKVELIERLNGIVDNAKLSKSAKSEFDELLKEFTTRKAKHADYFDEDEQCLMRFCKYHQRFERDEEMIAKKNYCRAASFISTQRRNKVKKLENELLSLIETNAETEKISELANIIKEKKANMHAPETYDYEKDKIYYQENCKQRNKTNNKE